MLRYRRKKKDNRDHDQDRDRSISAASGRGGGGGYYGGGDKRPESYNSMADSMAMFGGGVQEKKLPLMSPESDTTKVGGLSRMGTTTSRVMEGNNGNNDGRYNKQQNNTTTTGPSEPTGKAITVNYARNVKQSDWKPIKLSDPPPAKPKKAKLSVPITAAANNNDNIVSDDDDDERSNNPGDSGKWNLFPKVDPSPKRASRSLLNPFAGKQASAAAAKAATTTQDAQKQVAGRPNSSLQTPVNLQKWLQTATTVSPFGPLDNNDSSSNNQRPQAANPPAGGGREGGRGLPASVRLSEVKWPLQDSTSGPVRSESNGGMAAGTRGGDSGQVVVVRNNEAAKTVPKPIMGLPGPVRKLPLRDR